MMKVKIKIIFQYENAAKYNKAYEMLAFLHPAISNSQNAINVSEKLCKCVETEIYQTLNDKISEVSK